MTVFCSAQEFENLFTGLPDNVEQIRIQVKGGSMFPFIQSGDWVSAALYKGKHENVRKGDILLFRKDDKLYMHRMLRRVKDGFIVKGDMSFGHDGAICADDIMARVTLVERDGRRIDLGSKANHFVAVAAANTSELLQYPVLGARKIFSLGAAVFSRIQSLRTYRQLAKNILKADVVIREARPDDAEAIRDLFVMGGHDVKKDIVDIKKEGFWLVAERRGKIVSALTVTRLEKDPKLWVIFGLEVKPLLRGLGIGELITRDAALKAKENGAREVGLFVNKRAVPALKMYRKIGFKESDDFPKEFNRSPDEFYLSYKIHD